VSSDAITIVLEIICRCCLFITEIYVLVQVQAERLISVASVCSDLTFTGQLRFVLLLDRLVIKVEHGPNGLAILGGSEGAGCPASGVRAPTIGGFESANLAVNIFFIETACSEITARASMYVSWITDITRLLLLA